MLKCVEPGVFAKAEVEGGRGLRNSVEVSVRLENPIVVSLCSAVVLAEGSRVPMSLHGGCCGGIVGWRNLVMLGRVIDHCKR